MLLQEQYMVELQSHCKGSTVNTRRFLYRFGSSDSPTGTRTPRGRNVPTAIFSFNQSKKSRRSLLRGARPPPLAHPQYFKVLNHCPTSCACTFGIALYSHTAAVYVVSGDGLVCLAYEDIPHGGLVK